MIYLEEFTPFQQHYAALPLEPVRVTVELVTEVVMYDPIHLDNLLGAAVVMEATKGAMLGDSMGENYAIPLPLQVLWAHPVTGLPLWAATNFEPVSIHERSVSYTQRRGLNTSFVREDKGKPFNPNPKLGRFKETRIPMPTVVCHSFQADCIGHADTIASLLTNISHVGKRRGEGKGLVDHWKVEPIAQFSLLSNAVLRRTIPMEAMKAEGLENPNEYGVLRRAIPVEAMEALGIEIPNEYVVRRMGWTPPYWTGVPDSRGLCVPEGVMARQSSQGKPILKS